MKNESKQKRFLTFLTRSLLKISIFTMSLSTVTSPVLFAQMGRSSTEMKKFDELKDKKSDNSKKPPSDSVVHGESLVSIDFPNGVNLSDIIKTIGMWTGRNFILSQGVASSARISIISPEPMTKEEAYQAFLSALNISGFTTVETGSIVKILPLANARSSNIKTYYGESWAPATDEVINQIVPLQNIDVNSVNNQLRTIFGSTQYSVFTTTNSLILTDTGNRIRRLLEVIKLLDSKTNQPQVVIEPINYMDAKDAAAKVTEIFGSRGGAQSLSLQKVLVDERTNSLILVGPPNGLDDVVRFIHRIDTPAIDEGTQTLIRVRPLDYADAEKLAQTLQALAQGASSNRAQGGANNFPPPYYFQSQQNQGQNQPESTNRVADLNGVKITADKATNSLVIQGSRAAFEELNSLISQLDKRRAQVYIESDIIDLQMNNGFDWNPSVLGAVTSGGGRYTIPFGFNVSQAVPFTTSQTGTTTTLSNNPLSSIGSNAILGILSNTPINIGNGLSLTPGALIFALKTNTNANVLQTPSMMVSDNEEANFQSNLQFNTVIPIANPNGQGIIQQPQKYDVVTSLKVTPQISRANFVNMKMELQLDDAGAFDIKSGFPNPISKRSAKSTVTVQNGQTAVLGGLTSDSTKVSEIKVPLLGDIPILGWLFKSESKVREKRSLTLFVTPHIVRDSKDLEKIYKQKIKDRDEFLKVYYGSNYKEESFYSSLPPPDAGNVPMEKALENSNSTVDRQMIQTPKNRRLPSEERNPITAPSSGAGGNVSPTSPGSGTVPSLNSNTTTSVPAPPPLQGAGQLAPIN